MNADLVGAFNILRKLKTITPSLLGLTAGRGNWPRTRPGGFGEHSLSGSLMRTPQTSCPWQGVKQEPSPFRAGRRPELNFFILLAM